MILKIDWKWFTVDKTHTKKNVQSIMIYFTLDTLDHIKNWVLGGKKGGNSVNFKNWDNKLLSREIKCIYSRLLIAFSAVIKIWWCTMFYNKK